MKNLYRACEQCGATFKPVWLKNERSEYRQCNRDICNLTKGKIMTHTKGPWELEIYDETKRMEIWGDNEYIATIPRSLYADRKANAKLIAKSPEMLEMLEYIREGALISDELRSKLDKLINEAKGI